MTRDEAIEAVCAIVSLAYRSVGDYSRPSDGFCEKCRRVYGDAHYQNAGHAIAFVREAVIEKLNREGILKL